MTAIYTIESIVDVNGTMPFTGMFNGEIVWPDDVDDDALVTCLECRDDMHVRRGHTTRDGVLKPRCFVHNPDTAVGGMCPGGESDEHKLMKYVVTRRLQRMFGFGEVQREKSIPNTDRIGDVVVDFGTRFDEFGFGVVAEVQYRHDDKNIEKVTTEYIQAGYSVYWFNESHFGDGYETVEFPDIVTVWPYAIPTTADWTGVEEPVKELERHGSRYPIEVKFPPDFFESHSRDLKNWWQMGSGQYDFDLVRPLSSAAASRTCDSCGDGATIYLFQDGVISTFRCDGCLPKQAEANTNKLETEDQTHDRPI